MNEGVVIQPHMPSSWERMQTSRTRLSFRLYSVRVPTDPYELEGFASDLARQMKTSTLLYFVELLEKHAEQRRGVDAQEEHQLEDRGICLRYG